MHIPLLLFYPKILLVEFSSLRPRNQQINHIPWPKKAHAAARQNPKCSNTCGLAVRYHGVSKGATAKV